MPNAIPLNAWMETLEMEYLSSFIPEGGASVKFAVTPEELKPGLFARVREQSQKRGFASIELNAGEMRAHMPQDIFFSMARQIDWRLLARRVVLRLASERGYRVEGIDAAATGNVFESVANANGLEAYFVLSLIRPEIQQYVYRNPNMVKDFRVAMTLLCDQEQPGGPESAGLPLLDWLTGTNTRVSSVRVPDFWIYTGINRVTARYFIESALYWIRFSGYNGTVVLFDNSRVTLARNPRDGLRYYTRAMAVEHYELLREFVDGVDKLANTLFVVVTSEDFLDEGSPRGYGIYPALRTRVMDDVRDRNLANPIASLVRLGQETA